ncbi:MAG: protease SohB [Methylococcales bacterium]|jgi:serine protease SohB|nr:protease SohB [Methylococcales bacterium]MBT7408233.1 protease SohB [Methylococcales bacterium]
MHFVFEYLLFIAEVITILVGMLMFVGGVIALSKKSKEVDPLSLEIKSINDKYHQMKLSILDAVLSKEQLKELNKEEKKQQKLKDKEKESNKNRLFVIDFDGDIKASEVNCLREAVTAILTVATKDDQVLLRLESGGGVVHGYGLAASQLARLKSQQILLTIAVDKVAASGGYMMAAVADKIIAAPFAILGSIGVLAQIPNFHKLLKKYNIDYEQHTAGEYKRTLTLFGENDDKAREKLQEELEETHTLFKSFLLEHRPALDMEKVATGEHWYGTNALELSLIDEIKTSDDFIMSACDESDVFEVSVVQHKHWYDKFSDNLTKMAESVVSRFNYGG